MPNNGTSPSATGSRGTSGGGCGKPVAIAVVVMLCLAAYAGRSGSGRTAETEPSSLVDTPASALPEPLPAPVQTTAAIEPLSRADVAAGARALAAMRAADGWSGAMVYSRNCYASLERRFAWDDLDRCGGFDASAAGLLDDATISDEAVTWFESETAAGRYLAAAMKAGSTPTDADVRWSKVGEALPATKVEADPSQPEASGATVDDSEGNIFGQ